MTRMKSEKVERKYTLELPIKEIDDLRTSITVASQIIVIILSE